MTARRENILRALREHPDWFVMIVQDDSEPSESIELADDQGNSYMKIRPRTLDAMLDHNELEDAGTWRPSLDITITKFRLTKGEG